MKKLIITILSIILYTFSYSQGIPKDSVMIVGKTGYILNDSGIVAILICKGDSIGQCFYHVHLNNDFYAYLEKGTGRHYFFYVKENCCGKKQVYLLENQ